MLLSISTLVHAEDPHEMFRTDNGLYDQVLISYRSSTNVQAACDAESKKRKLGGFNFAVEACNFRDINKDGVVTCLIIFPKMANFHLYGHELRHCFVGQFHK